jgi:hypothetical protein
MPIFDDTENRSEKKFIFKPIFAYIEHQPEWSDKINFIFSDLIAADKPEFVHIDHGDFLVTLEAIEKSSLGVMGWVVHHLYRVSGFEETGDAFLYDLEKVGVYSIPESGDLLVLNRMELLGEHSWFPAPNSLFQPLPIAVWNWIQEISARSGGLRLGA